MPETMTKISDQTRTITKLKHIKLTLTKKKKNTAACSKG